jgi:nitrite reductase (NADH) large subunit
VGYALRSQPAHYPPSMERPVAIVGMGPVGIRVAQELVNRRVDCPIAMYSDEPWQPYDRLRLSAVLSGQDRQDELSLLLQLPRGAQVTQHHHCKVVSIDRTAGAITDAAGRRHPYSDLILATGSRPHIPNIRGITLPGVYTFRDLFDAQVLLARTMRSRRTVVLGAGPLGLEAAQAMQRGHTRVTVIEQTPRLMSRHLDQDSSDMIREHLLSLGVQVIVANGVQEVLGSSRVEGVRLRNGRTLKCDTIVLAAGVRPNVALALDVGLKVGRGIQVDDHMETSDPHIFAVGECAEHQGRVYASVSPGLDQSAVAADRILGGSARYRGSIAVARLKVLRRSVFSMGAVGEEEHPLSISEHRFVNFSAGVYRKLVLRRGRLVGAIAVGEWDNLSRIQEAITNKRRIWFWQLRRFHRSGSLWVSAGRGRIESGRPNQPSAVALG